jgi:hypothetical protein
METIKRRGEHTLFAFPVSNNAGTLPFRGICKTIITLSHSAGQSSKEVDVPQRQGKGSISLSLDERVEGCPCQVSWYADRADRSLKRRRGMYRRWHTVDEGGHARRQCRMRTMRWNESEGEGRAEDHRGATSHLRVREKT